MIKDKYLRKRGGNTKIINVSWSECGNRIFIYQKDGVGWLKRCYLNRILEPKKYSDLKNNLKIKSQKDIKNLICSCGSVIGSPMKHKDERLAFKLNRGKFKRTINKNYK